MVMVEEYTPGTGGGPGGRDQTLAVKSRKKSGKSAFFRKKSQNYNFFCIYLLVMPKYWGKQNFTHGSKAKQSRLGQHNVLKIYVYLFLLNRVAYKHFKTRDGRLGHPYEKKLIFGSFFFSLRPTFGHGRLGHP